MSFPNYPCRYYRPRLQTTVLLPPSRMQGGDDAASRRLLVQRRRPRATTEVGGTGGETFWSIDANWNCDVRDERK